MKKVILLSVFLAGCVTTSDPSAPARTIEQARTRSDVENCLAAHQGGAFNKQVVHERKLDCKAVATAEYVRLVSISPNPDLCYLDVQSPDKFVTKEIKRRGINCEKVLALHYQQQSLLAQQQAARAQSQAASAAMLNALSPPPRYPTNTTCTGFGNTVNCHSY